MVETNPLIYLLILIAAFVGIVIWVFGRKRKTRFEKDANIPFDEGHSLELRWPDPPHRQSKRRCAATS